MLAGTSFEQALNNLNIEVPTTVAVPVSVSDKVRPGQLRPLATWGPWVSIGAAVLTGVRAAHIGGGEAARESAHGSRGFSAAGGGGGGRRRRSAAATSTMR